MKRAFLSVFLLLQMPVFPQSRLQSLLSELKTARSDSGKVLAYKQLSDYYKPSVLDSALFFAREGLEFAKKVGYRKGELTMISQLSSVNQNHGNLEVARKYGLEALKGFEEIEDLRGVAAANNGLGIIEGRKGNLNVATAYFIKALRLFEKADYIPGIIQTYIKLGVINEQYGNFDKALDYLSKCGKLNTGKNYDAAVEVNIINNAGIIHAQKGDMQKALRLFKEGISKSASPELAAVHVSLLTNAGNASKSLGKIAMARAYHNGSLEKARAFHLPEEEARALLNLSSVLGKESTAKAVAYMQNALLISKKIGQKRLTSEIYEGLSEKYQQMGDYKAALFAVKEQHKLLDSIYNISKEREIANLQAGYELDKSKQHIQTLELLNEKRTLERNAGVVAAILVSLTLILLGLYLHRVRKLNHELKASNQVKDKLFSIIGHDLRSPVGTVVQMLDVIDQSDLEAFELREMLSILKKHTQASLETLDTLLQWGKSQLQGVRVTPTVFNPESIIERNLEILSVSAGQKYIRIIKSVPADLELYSDPDHFNFVVRNLLSNAVKFTYPSGEVKVSVSGYHSKPGYITFSVKDNGKGISEKDKEVLFESFSGADHGTAGEKGTGIGLILCKEFVQANNGEIWVESREGDGSEFFFTVKTATKSNLPKKNDTAGQAV